MDISTVKDWVATVAAILGFMLSIYAVLTKSSQANTDKIVKIDERLDDHSERLQKVEGDIKHLPDTDAVHSMQLSMKDMQIEMATMAAEAQASNRTLRRMEDFLMKKGTEA